MEKEKEKVDFGKGLLREFADFLGTVNEVAYRVTRVDGVFFTVENISQSRGGPSAEELLEEDVVGGDDE